MIMNKIIGALALALSVSAAVGAGKLCLEVRPNRPLAMYACGETAKFVVKVTDTNGVPLKAGKVTTVLDNFGPHIVAPTNVVDLANGNPFTVCGTLAEPGFLRLVLRSDLAGFPTTQYRQDEWFASVGFEPEKLRPAAPCPADFDAFWAKGREEVKKVPLDAKVEPSAKWSNANWNVWGVSFATLGGRRVYGWLAKEKSVKGKLPVIVQVAAAGFGGWSQNPRMTPGYLNLFMTVFPFPPDAETQKPAYEKLNADCRAKWPGASRYCTAGIASDDPRDCYFYPVLLGIDRAIDWVAAREDADLGRFVYDGTSQGGGFGLFCVGLNRHFTKGVFHVPALTDHSAHRAGRFDGWPQFWKEQTNDVRRAAVERNAPYYDGVNFAQRIRVPVTVTCGTADSACHPHCVWTAYNQIPAKDKRIKTGFAMPHGEWGQFYLRTAEWLKDDGAAASAPEAGHVTIADKPRPASEDPNHWWWKPLAYRENEVKKKSAADVVWLGDSITHYFDNPENRPLWQKWFGGKTTGAPYLGLNFGIEGDTTDNLLFRMKRSLGKLHPKAFVLLIGTNNTGMRSLKDEPPEDTVKGLKAILDELRRTQPQATVLVYAIFPRGLGVKDPCMVRNEKVNEGLEKLCDGRQCIFRNINDVFLWPDGSVNEKLLGDRLHPSREGYEVWLGDVLPQLRRIIK